MYIYNVYTAIFCFDRHYSPPLFLPAPPSFVHTTKTVIRALTIIIQHTNFSLMHTRITSTRRDVWNRAQSSPSIFFFLSYFTCTRIQKTNRFKLSRLHLYFSNFLFVLSLCFFFHPFYQLIHTRIHRLSSMSHSNNSSLSLFFLTAKWSHAIFQRFSQLLFLFLFFLCFVSLLSFVLSFILSRTNSHLHSFVNRSFFTHALALSVLHFLSFLAMSFFSSSSACASKVETLGGLLFSHIFFFVCKGDHRGRSRRVASSFIISFFPLCNHHHTARRNSK